MRLIGILGGTFNPIHYGHLRMAQEIAEALKLNEVRFIPSANPPHKALPTVSADSRAEMVQLAIADNPLFKLDTRELNRSGASYTIDTLVSLRSEINPEQNSKTAFCLIMGTDAFVKFNTWHRWQEILSYCHIILVQRSVESSEQQPLADELAQLLQNLYTENVSDLSSQEAGFIHMQNITSLSISSTMIRSAFRLKRIPRYLTPPSIIEYIEENQFYK